MTAQQDLSSINQSSTDLTTLVALLHQIVHGDSATQVTTDAGQQPSLAKAVTDAVTGAAARGYETKADMDADIAHPENTMAQVMNDPEVSFNTFYRKVGPLGSGHWQARSESPLDAAKDRIEAIELVVDNTKTHTGVLFAIVDDKNRVAFGVDAAGAVIGSLRAELSAITARLDALENP